MADDSLHFQISKCLLPLRDISTREQSFHCTVSLLPIPKNSLSFRKVYFHCSIPFRFTRFITEKKKFLVLWLRGLNVSLRYCFFSNVCEPERKASHPLTFQYPPTNPCFRREKKKKQQQQISAKKCVFARNK